MKYAMLLVALMLTSCTVAWQPRNNPSIGYDQLANATVGLITDDDRSMTYCSGVLTEGYIVTAAHCVDDAEEVLVGLRRDFRTRSRRFSRTYRMPVLYTDTLQDVAIVQAPSLWDLRFLDIGPPPTTGQDVVAMGHAMGHHYHFCRGEVTATWRSTTLPFADARESMRWLRTNCELIPGMSGGPIVDSRNRVLGVNSFTWYDVYGHVHRRSILEALATQ